MSYAGYFKKYVYIEVKCKPITEKVLFSTFYIHLIDENQK